MSTHKASIDWKNRAIDFTYDTYSREHIVKFESGTELVGSSAPEFLGDKSKVNPEEMLVGALASCHMLTFLAVAARKRFHVVSYKDQAIATLEKNAHGKMSITHVRLQPQVTFLDKTPSQSEISEIHKKAHDNCFIANSVNFEVHIDG